MVFWRILSFTLLAAAFVLFGNQIAESSLSSSSSSVMDQHHSQNSNSLPSASISAATSSTTAEATPPQPPSSASQTPSPTPIPRTLSSPATTQPSPQLPAPSLPAPSPARPSSSPSAFSRTWQQQHHTQFSSPQSPSIPSSPRGSMAIGVPAGHPSPSLSQPSHFSGSFGHQFGGAASSNVRPQGMGMVGSLGAGVGGHHQLRPVQSPIRPPSSPSTQSTTQSFQGHGLMRPSMGSASPASTATQGAQLLNQPWLSGGSQGKPPLPVPPYRPHIGAPSMQQRSHIPQPQHHLSSAPQQQSVASPQSQQSLPLNQHDHASQQLRVQQPLPHQYQFPRPQVSTSQKPSPIAMAQQNKVQTETQTRTTSSESDESGSRILSKRSIHELVSQIDPSERLEPDVEDILVDIAEDFVDSITTFSCSLAKHRKSDTLEAKDILLHLERNWNMTLPGFTGDEIKTYKKQLTTDIHKERLATIKKSILATEGANARSSAGQSAVSMKGGQGKAPANILGSPNFKAREVS